MGIESDGFILVPRRIFEIFRMYPEKYFCLWSMMMICAPHKNGVRLGAGQLQWSLTDIVDTAKGRGIIVSRSLVRRFLEAMILEDEIEVDILKRPHVITMKNYKKYQDFSFYKLPETFGRVGVAQSRHNSGTIAAQHAAQHAAQQESPETNKNSSAYNKQKDADGTTCGTVRDRQATQGATARRHNTVFKPLKTNDEKSLSRSNTQNKKNPPLPPLKGGRIEKNVENSNEKKTNPLNSNNKPVENSKRRKKRPRRQNRDDPKIGSQEHFSRR